MIHLKDNPVGIDFVIQRSQKKIFNYLESLGYDIDGYGRTYLEKDSVNGKDVIVPKWYKSPTESELVLYSEHNKFFFTTNGVLSSKGIGVYSTRISVYFCFDLSKVKPNVKHRGDNEIMVECHKIFKKCALGEFDIETGFKRVFQDFKVSGTDYETEDVGRYHWFKFTTKETEFKIDKMC